MAEILKEILPLIQKQIVALTARGYEPEDIELMVDATREEITAYLADYISPGAIAFKRKQWLSNGGEA